MDDQVPYLSTDGWFSAARIRWDEAYPRCAQPGCSPLRRMWSCIARRKSGIRLQGLHFCALRCFEYAARDYFALACSSAVTTAPARHRIPLGLLMLSRGELTRDQLRAAIDAQTAAGQHRLGDWLTKLGFATEQQITTALGLQWSCPVLAARLPPISGCGDILPQRLLERFRMLPVQFVTATRTLLVAFCDGVDYGVLYSIEQMLDCRTQACVIGHAVLEQELERLGREPRPHDRVFETSCDTFEMARITCSYVQKLSASDVRIAGCGEYVWVRLETGGEFATLLFRRPVASPGTAVPSPTLY